VPLAASFLFVARIPRASLVDPSFAEFLPHFEEADQRFINGDPSLWKQIASRSADATTMAGWGGYEKGWHELEKRYDWAAARFQESGAKVNVEYLSSGVSGTLAYTVAIEQCSPRLIGEDEPTTIRLRVTNIFQKENREWKLLHHHADPIVSKISSTEGSEK
jgi:ketosteroid isomerase-like protein